MQTGKGEQNFWQEGPQQAPPAQGPPVPPSIPTPQPPANQPSQLPQQSTAPQPPLVEQALPSSEPQIFVAQDFQAPTAPVTPEVAPISWEASEFIHHQKSATWFIGLGVVAVALLAAALFILKDWFAAIGIAIMIVAVGAMASRSPKTIRYLIDNSSVRVGERSYAFREFQSFSLNKEGQIWSVILLPSGRFKPSITIYFDEAEGEQIVDALGAHLPMEEHKPDMIDKFSSKIRF